MGITNHGTQSVSHQYYEEVKALLRNCRVVNILPRGIYSGGLLTRVNDTQITLSPATVEIGDTSVQVRVATAADATITNATLDSGTISPATPYIVLRWAYAASSSNYMEIHAVAAALANDVVVGRIVFSGSVITGFDYTERTMLTVQNLWLEPVQYGSGTTMYVLLRPGRVHTGESYVTIQEYPVGPFVAPASPHSRIDLIYIDDNGVPQILQGTAAVVPTAPNYAGKLVVAEVTLVNGMTGITQSRIRDVRSFLSRQVVPDNQTVMLDSDGKLSAKVSGLVPKWNVTVCDANNLTTSAQFVSPIVEFSIPSFGTYCGAHSNYSQYWMYGNSARFRMTVTSVGNNIKNLKLFSVAPRLYVYVDGNLVFSQTTSFHNYNVPLNVALNLTDGDHVIDLVYASYGSDYCHFNLVGDIVDGTNVKFKA